MYVCGTYMCTHIHTFIHTNTIPGTVWYVVPCNSNSKIVINCEKDNGVVILQFLKFYIYSFAAVRKVYI